MANRNRLGQPLDPVEKEIADAIAQLPLKDGLTFSIGRSAQTLAFISGMLLLNDLPRASDTRKENGADQELEKLAKLMVDMHRHVGSMHADSHAAVDRIPRREGLSYKRPPLIGLENELAEWFRVIGLARENMKPRPPQTGRPKKQGAYLVAHHLVREFEMLTGKAATITVDPITNEAKGEFIAFVDQVFSALGLDASPAAQAKTAIAEAKAGKDPRANTRMVQITKVENPKTE